MAKSSSADINLNNAIIPDSIHNSVAIQQVHTCSSLLSVGILLRI